MMAQSWPFVAEIVGTPCNVIDLQNFAHSVRIIIILVMCGVNMTCVG